MVLPPAPMTTPLQTGEKSDTVPAAAGLPTCASKLYHTTAPFEKRLEANNTCHNNQRTTNKASVKGIPLRNKPYLNQ